MGHLNYRSKSYPGGWLCAAFSMAFLFAVGGCGGEVASSADRVRATGTAWEESYNQRDLTGLSTVYAEHAVSMPPGAPAVYGRDAILAKLASLFSAFSPRHESTIEDLIVKGDIAIERAAYIDRLTPLSGGSGVVEQGKHVVVYRRDDAGEWKVLWEIWNHDE